ncbi:MAG: DUF1501 domain-containing protein [Planctomycetota bacterium]|nr:DUF1501 domain-containing protein [Planctomycetota bacterium]
MSANEKSDPRPLLSRRHLLQRAGCGVGMMGLLSLLHEEGLLAQDPTTSRRSANPLAPKSSHTRPTAKSVIWLFINGGPSHVDTWDYKPVLAQKSGQSVAGFDRFTGFFANAVGGLMPSPFRFRQHGQSGKWVSDLFPHLAQHVDEMAFVHSGYTQSNNHSPALFMMNTGFTQMGFPCVGAWSTYGLGSESRDLPAFVVMSDPKGRGLPKGYSQNWGAGFLPSIYQGSWLKPQGEPIENLRPPVELTPSRQRAQLDLLAYLNQQHQRQRAAQHDLLTRIESFELAYRMQSAAPEALDLAGESKSIQQQYGLDDPSCRHFAQQCLLARRMVERGVRFVQIYSGGNENQRSWDGHNDIRGNHQQFAGETDKPIAGLLADLKQRGLLDTTLVMWCGEFGRLPMAQKAQKPGRDHNPHAFTCWLAGGGIKGGTQYGTTDDIGHRAVENRASVHDLHATLLHLLGLEHKRLTFRHNGRDFRLTDVAGQVIHDIVS